MEIKSIDVSSYQGKPDWAKVKKAGINFAILRIHQKNGPIQVLNIIIRDAGRIRLLWVDTNTVML